MVEAVKDNETTAVTAHLLHEVAAKLAEAKVEVPMTPYLSREWKPMFPT